MNLSELAGHDGRDGRKAYIAVNGKVYDVTDSPRWQGGMHPPDHQAGQDLTGELATAPHVRAVVERFPVVGTLEDEPEQAATGGKSKTVIAIVVATLILAMLIFMLI